MSARLPRRRRLDLWDYLVVACVAAPTIVGFVSLFAWWGAA